MERRGKCAGRKCKKIASLHRLRFHIIRESKAGQCQPATVGSASRWDISKFIGNAIIYSYYTNKLTRSPFAIDENYYSLQFFLLFIYLGRIGVRTSKAANSDHKCENTGKWETISLKRPWREASSEKKVKKK